MESLNKSLCLWGLRPWEQYRALCNLRIGEQIYVLAVLVTFANFNIWFWLKAWNFFFYSSALKHNISKQDNSLVKKKKTAIKKKTKRSYQIWKQQNVSVPKISLWKKKKKIERNPTCTYSWVKLNQEVGLAGAPWMSLEFKLHSARQR